MDNQEIVREGELKPLMPESMQSRFGDIRIIFSREDKDHEWHEHVIRMTDEVLRFGPAGGIGGMIQNEYLRFCEKVDAL